MNSWFVEQVKKSDIECLDIGKTSIIFGVKLDDIFNKIQGAIVINSADEIDVVVGLANSQQIGLLPIYSKSQLKPEIISASKAELYLLDLSRLKSIQHSEDIITIEAGVTQRELFDFFKDNNIKKMMPTTWIDHGGSIVEELISKRKGIVKYDAIQNISAISAVCGDGTKIEITKANIDSTNVALMRNVALSEDLSIVKNISFTLKDECKSSLIVEIDFKQKHLIKNIIGIDQLKGNNEAICGSVFLNEHAVNRLIFKKELCFNKKIRHKKTWTGYTFVTGTKHAVNSAIQDVDSASAKYFFNTNSYFSINLFSKIARILPSILSKKLEGISEFKLKLKSSMKGYTDCFKFEKEPDDSNTSITMFRIYIDNNEAFLDSTMKEIEQIQTKYQIIPMILIQSIGNERVFSMDIAIAMDKNSEEFEDKRRAIKENIQSIPFISISEMIECMEENSLMSIKEKVKSSFDKRNVLNSMREKMGSNEKNEDMPSWFTGSNSHEENQNHIAIE